MIYKQIFPLLMVLVLSTSCGVNNEDKGYLNIVLENLDRVESASYHQINEAWSPGDTAASFIFTTFVREYRNTSDTSIGASFVVLDSLTGTKPSFCYDGFIRATFYNDEKGIVVDSFKVRSLPFRPLTPPFYNYVTSILKYALSTGDSTILLLQELESDVFLRLTINEEEQVEFFGKPFRMPPSPYTSGDNTSVYEMWIDKETTLPYRVRREMSHDISVSEVVNPQYNKLDISHFVASDYFPADYEIRQYGYSRTDEKKSALLNHEAPGWALQSADNHMVSLADIRSRVVLLQFTSVSCGPCRASIPFLKELHHEYDTTDFKLLAIECTSKNLNALENYMNRNQFDYMFLQADKEVLRNYSVGSYPVFYVLDKDRIIREVINGYAEGATDERIRFTINKLLE